MNDLLKQVELVRLAELSRVYDFMTENEWESVFDAKDDWIVRRMRENNCLSRSAVKERFNEIAEKLNIPNRL